MTVTAEGMVRAARWAAVALANDPKVCHYAPETVALVLGRVVANMAGAGSLDVMAERMGTDPKLSGIPIDVLDAISGPAFTHFALALGKLANVEDEEAGNEFALNAEGWDA